MSESTKKRWWIIAAGAVATAFLGAFGAWLWNELAGPRLADAFGGDPIAVHVSDWQDGCNAFAVPESLLESIPAEPSDRELFVAEIDGAWVVEHGGIPLAPRVIELTIHGLDTGVVTVHDIDVVDFEEVELDEDVVVVRECIPHGGPGDVSLLAMDMSSTPPVVGLSDPELRFPFEVAVDDPEHFDLEVLNSGDGCYCRWGLEVAWSVDAEEHTLAVEGRELGVSTAVYSSDWEEYWFIDGAWSTDYFSE
ncbi:hypothetical protein [Agromyces mangrovi Wang et al. 2018]|uniref:hypothetical protein n=1 Tax=Agromyces mangrovi TaxID=1858653 RepID=UPI0025741DF3|nr:hypothetical protein [Agromyces mangrovi]BDZ65485.1 hypothetical protein GCM10025877_24230 [Agromyces mangrovi]